MSWLKGFLQHNWWLKLLALGLAYALWALATQSPTVEISVSVPLELRKLPPGLHVAGEFPPQVHLHLRGSGSRLRTLRPEKLGVGVDLSGIAAGNHWFLLDPRDVNAPPGIEVVDITPAQVQLQLVER